MVRGRLEDGAGGRPVGAKAFARTREGKARASQPLAGYVVEYPRPCPIEGDAHRSFEVGIVLEGAQERYYEDFVMSLLPGDLWLAAAWEPHGGRTTAVHTRVALLVFRPEVLGEEKVGGLSWLALFAAAPRHRPRVTTPAMRQEVLAIGREIADELELRRPAYMEAVRLGLLRALFAVGREWAWRLSMSGEGSGGAVPGRGRSDQAGAGRAGEAAPAHTHLPRLMPAIELVQSDPGRRATVQEAAAACCLSVSQFSHQFRLTMGVSFGRFVLRSRLAHAARLLLFTDLSVERIAHDLGFVSGSHLQLLFRKHYGCTPGHYRKVAGLV